MWLRFSALILFALGKPRSRGVGRGRDQVAEHFQRARSIFFHSENNVFLKLFSWFCVQFKKIFQALKQTTIRTWSDEPLNLET
jgi:hypothetical protein